MKKSLICVLLLFAFLTSGCGLATTYKDTNGASDYCLQYLTEEDLLKKNNSSSVAWVGSAINGKHNLSIGTFNGVKTLERFSGEHTVTLSCSIQKGNARLVLCTSDQVLHEFSLNEDEQQYTVDGSLGEVYLKLAGESCGITIRYTVD